MANPSTITDVYMNCLKPVIFSTNGHSQNSCWHLYETLEFCEDLRNGQSPKYHRHLYELFKASNIHHEWPLPKLLLAFIQNARIL
jgi:hypothetical protein